jgi:hypothetical protein
MEEIISKEELSRLLETRGEIRGFAIKPMLDFIIKEEGENGFESLSGTMSKLGSPIDYKNVKTIDFYPFNWHIVFFVVIQKLFNYDNKKFQEIGVFSAKAPFTVRRFMMQALPRLPFERIIKETEKIWRKFSTVGDLKIIKVDAEQKELIMRFEDFALHPLMCQLVIGYFSSVAGILIGKKSICEQIKAVYKGDDYDEFLIKW